jgi:hypothetical protein
MTGARVEYRYPIGAGADALLVFDGRVVDYFNLYTGGTTRFPYPETRWDRKGPDRKGRVTFTAHAAGHPILEFPVEPDHVAGFDSFLAALGSGAGGA